MKRLIIIIVCLLAIPTYAQNDAAPDLEFKRVAEMVQKAVPSQELIETLYAYMEKWPKDSRGDQVQFWVGQVQQKRKFHHEAIKEFGYVIKDFPTSPLILQALRAQAGSYQAVEQHKEAVECFKAIIDRKPKDLNKDAGDRDIYRDAVIFLAERAVRQKEFDEAVAMFTQLPDQRESVSRIVELYVSFDRYDDAMKAIQRLPESDKMLGYRLLIRLYASRPGVNNLVELQQKIFDNEKPGEQKDHLVRQVVEAISGKGGDERRKALERVVEKYDRLKRWAAFSLCDMDRGKDMARLTTFIGDYRTGGDVEQCKTWIGEFHESASDPEKAREAYGQLNDKVNGHFRIAETYYGPRAKKPDLEGGEKELTEIVKRFYSNGVCCDALIRRAELQAGRMKKPEAACTTYRELIERFPAEGDWPIRAYMQMAGVLRNIKKQDEAIQAYDAVILKFPDRGAARQAWLEIAGCYEEKQDPKKAIETYRTVLRKYPRTGAASTAHTILETRYKIADTDVSDR